MSVLVIGVGMNGNWGQLWNVGILGFVLMEISGQLVLQNQDLFKWNSCLGVGVDVGVLQVYGFYGNGLFGGGMFGFGGFGG